MGSEHGSALAAVGFHGQSLSSPPGSRLRASVSPPCKVGVTLSGADRVRRVTDVTGAARRGPSPTARHLLLLKGQPRWALLFFRILSIVSSSKECQFRGLESWLQGSRVGLTEASECRGHLAASPLAWLGRLSS